ncbi:MAG: hypothetical protein SFV18_04870 [Bryobacteraceae bacterium]|nr:hypothetical protein [Bryobacteraceae bacterium]
MFAIFGWLLFAATLEKLALSEMTDKSTEIVRARVGNCAGVRRGGAVYTTCQLTPLEWWKGAARPSITVRQSFPGGPFLKTGEEMVFFLWTGPSGIAQVMGLTQGMVGIERSASSEPMAVRSPIRDRLLDSNGKPTFDDGLDMPLAELKRAVTSRSAQ